MALPVTIPNEFANATASIPLSQLDANFNTLANAVNGISDGSETLANVTATVGNITTINATTVDTTNIEVTNIKAKDGTSAGSIADSTGVVTLASSVLTTTDINGGTIDGTAIGGASAAAGSFTTLNTSGQVVFNDAGADVDFRVEGDTDANLLFVDAGNNRVGIGTSSPAQKLDVIGGTIYEQVQLGTNNTSNSAQRTGINYRNYANTDNIALIHGSDTAGTNAQVFVGGITNNPNSISFYTTGTYGVAGTERMRIDSSGNVLVGTTTYTSGFAGAGAIVKGPVNYNGFNTTSNLANGASETIYTFSSEQGNYLISGRQAGLTNGGIRALALVCVGTSSLAVVSLDATSMSFSAVGSLGIQITNSAGGATSFNWSMTKIL